MHRSLLGSATYIAIAGAVLLAAGLPAAPALAQVKITTVEEGEPDTGPDTGSDQVLTITRAELAQLVFRVYAPEETQVPDPITAFADLRDFGLIPEHWNESEIVTQADLAEILHRLGVQYHPGSENAPVSRAFVEAMLRRYLGQLKSYMGRRIEHGADVDQILVEGGGGVVSPFRF